MSRAEQILQLARNLGSSEDPEKKAAADAILDLMAFRLHQDDHVDADISDLAEIALRGVPDGPWLYRPEPTDDWGEIRSRDGFIVAKVNLRAGPEELSKHRKNGTDPAETIGRFIARARTLVPALIRELRRLTSQVEVSALDPDMPAQELRLHMGEMSAQEMRTARAAIRWANSAINRSSRVTAGEWVLQRMDMTGESREKAEISLVAALNSGAFPDKEMMLTSPSPDFGKATHRHRKGGFYRVLCPALLESDLREMVIYQSMSDSVIWIRPAEEFYDGRFTPLEGGWFRPSPKRPEVRDD